MQKMSRAIKLQEYFNSKKYNNFDAELSKYVGAITRLFVVTLSQTSDVYFELRDQAKCAVYEKLLTDQFDSSKGDFGNYVFTIIRGEITKFFNKYNRTRKFSDISKLKFKLIENRENLDDINFQYFFYDEINIILKKYNIYDLNIREISYFYQSFDKNIDKKKLLYLKLVSWEYVIKNNYSYLRLSLTDF